MPFAPDSLIAAAPQFVQAGWIDALAPLVLIVVYVLRQVFAAMAEQREAERAKQQRPAPGPRPEQADVGPQRELRSEVEEFLKRVNEARDGKGAQQPAPAQQAETPPPRRGPIDPFEEPVRRPRPKRPEPTPAPKPIELLVEPEPAAAHRPDPEPLRHLPESQLAEEAAHLGERIASADERIEARLQEKFDHRLGKIERDATPVEEAEPDEPAPAARIKRLLSRPGGVREAVVLSEVLSRRGDTL